MFIINTSYTSERIVKNSRFITLLFHINNKDEIDLLLNKTKKEYPKATHYCYAYIVDNHKKASDDGEPGGTAGMPILNVLEKENLTSILVIVVRYFGGIKLGAGGLVRAYSKSVREALEHVTKIPLVEGYKLIIEFNYTKQKDFDYLLKEATIIKKEFLDKIKYTLFVDESIYEKIIQSDCRILVKEQQLIETKN